MSNPYRGIQRIAFITGLCVLSFFPARAQQSWFVFIQSDNQQPFYVRIGEDIHSSSSVGHLVVHGLKDSTYQVIIGFPQNRYREQRFPIRVNRKDHGYQLRRNSSGAWVLYNWITEETLRPPRDNTASLYGEKKKNDGFATLMSAVVNDSAVLYTSVLKTTPKKDTAKAVVKADYQPAVDSAVAVVTGEPVNTDTGSVKKKQPDALAATDSAVADTAATTITITQYNVVDTAEATGSPLSIDSAIAIDQPQLPSVTQLSEQTAEDEKKLVFLDRANPQEKDTITVIIPFEKPAKDSLKALQQKPVAAIETVADTMPVPGENTSPVVDTAAVFNDPLPVEKDTATVTTFIQTPDTPDAVTAPAPDTVALTTDTVTEKETGLVMINSDCRKFATEHDVDKLRVKLLNQKENADRLYAAQKSFRSMCYTVKQVRALSELFPGDEWKFRFFETAYPFISDSSNFKQLGEILTDQFFITRFNTLLRR